MNEQISLFDNKPVLDPCCGSKMFWFDKHNPKVLFTDIREMEEQPIWKSTKNDSVRTCEVKPDMIADVTHLPFEDNTFWHIIFDPPHLIRLGETSWMAKKYGRLDKDNWQEMIHDGFWECWRVLKPNGTLVFKWAEIDIKLSEILKVIGKQPMYGNRSGKHMSTHWLVFMKFEDDE